MADKIVIELDLEAGDVKDASKELEKAGAKAGNVAAIRFRRNFNKGLASSFKAIGSQAAKLTSIIGGLSTAFLGFQSIRAAQVQEDAVNRLNNALATAGDFSQQASKDLQQYASNLQQVTRFGDEAILNQLALAKSFGATNDQTKEILSAAADLSAAFGIDLESATRNVAKTLGGFAGELGEVIPELKNLSQEQLRAGQGIALLAEQFRGSALRDVNTFSGAVQQMSNAFGDVLEEIGKYITQNPKFVAIVKQATKFFVTLGSEISNFAKTTDVFTLITGSLIKFNNAMVTYVVKPFELFFNVIKIVGDAFSLFVNSSINNVGKLAGGLSKFLNLFGVDNKLTVAMQGFSQATQKAANEDLANLKNSLSNVFNFPLSEQLSQKNTELRLFFEEQNAIINENAQKNTENFNQRSVQAAQNLTNLSETFQGIYNGLTMGISFASDNMIDKIKQVNDRMKAFALDAGKALQVGLGNAAGQAFAEFGAAVQAGDNALQAFTDSLLKSLGQQAIALGTKFILEGTAYLFTPGFQALGGNLIAAGAALAAFGGVLGASVGGSASGGSGGGSAVATAQDETTTEELASPEARTRAEERVNLQVNVEGSLVRESELNGYVSEILENGANRNATVIPSLKTGLV